MNLHESLLVLSSNYKQTYYFSNYWVFTSITQITIEYTSKVRKEFLHFNDIYFNLTKAQEAIKTISSEFLNYIYYALKSDDFNLYGFVLCLIRLRDSCKIHDELTTIKEFLSIIFNNKLKETEGIKRTLRELYNISYIVPKFMLNNRISLLLDLVENPEGKKEIKETKSEDGNFLKSRLITKIVVLNTQKKKIEEKSKNVNFNSEE